MMTKQLSGPVLFTAVRPRLRCAAILIASVIAVVTSGGGAWAFTRPATPPEPNTSDDVIVAKTEYDALGRPRKVTDNLGMVTVTYYDALSRTTHTVENFTPKSSDPDTFDPDAPGSRSADENRVTKYVYNAAGQTIEQVAIDPDADGVYTDNQSTYYIYSDETSDLGSPVKTFSYLRAIVYPDALEDNSWTTRSAAVSAVDAASGGGGDFVEMTYYANGALATRTDQRGVTITYHYHDDGARKAQVVTLPGGSAVDDSVLAMTYQYDALRRPRKLTSHGNATSDPADTTDIVNQVAYEYDGLGQLVKDRQDHDSAVDAPAPGSVYPTHDVTYAYDTTTSSYQYIKAHRRVSMTYPNGRMVHTTYGAPGSIDDLTSRASGLAENDDATPNTPGSQIVSYSYLGDGTPIIKDMPVPQFKLDYAFGGTSGDPIPGLDRFGHVTAQRWVDYSGGVGNEGDIFHVKHGYDRASNRLYADRQVYSGQSDVYSHDGLHRLKALEAGKIKSDQSGIESTWLTRSMDYTLDQLGNQISVSTEAAASYIKDTQLSAANEIESFEVKGNKGIPYFGDEFSSTSTLSQWQSIGGVGDTFEIADGALKITAVSADSFDTGGGSKTETEPRTVILFGDEIGPAGNIANVKFPVGGSGVARAGLVFGYQDANNYWVRVIEYDYSAATTKSALYHVVDGARQLKASNNMSAATPGSDKYYDIGALSNTETSWHSYDYPDGYPAGRVGVYSDTADVHFNMVRIYDNALNVDIAGRWKGLSPWAIQYSNSLGVTNNGAYRYRPKLIHGLRMGTEPFRATFMFHRGTATRNHDRVGFVFNATNDENLTYLEVAHRSDIQFAPQAFKMEGGHKPVAVSATRDNSAMPLAANATDDLWVRVEYDGSVVTVKAAVDNSSEPTWGTLSPALTTNSFVMAGGAVGFRAVYGQAYVQNVRVEAYRDTDGDGTADAWVTEHEDDFTLDGSGYAEQTLTHDAAGNLTFDGVFAYSYDAWNRMVEVAKAYRDPGSGTLQTGSTINTIGYDALGRRTVKAVANSGDLDFTYHYYYNGQSLIETRDGSDNVVKHHVWGLTYIDELVQVSVAKSVNADPAAAGTSWARHFYAAHNANYNILGLLEAVTGYNDSVTLYPRLVERYEYTPYGQRQVYSHGWLIADMNKDGAIGTGDMYLHDLDYGKTEPGLNGDFDGDGDADDDDKDLVALQYYASTTVEYPDDPLVMYPTLGSFRAAGGGADGIALNEIGHQGLHHDEETGLVYNRARMLHPRIGRFAQRDPLGYVDGMSVYAYYAGMRGRTDPTGLYWVELVPKNPTNADLGLDDFKIGWSFKWQWKGMDTLSGYAQLNEFYDRWIGPDWVPGSAWEFGDPKTIIDNNYFIYQDYWQDTQATVKNPEEKICAYQEHDRITLWLLKIHPTMPEWAGNFGLAKLLLPDGRKRVATHPPGSGTSWGGEAETIYSSPHHAVRYIYEWIDNTGKCCGKLLDRKGPRYRERLTFVDGVTGGKQEYISEDNSSP